MTSFANPLDHCYATKHKKEALALFDLCNTWLVAILSLSIYFLLVHSHVRSLTWHFLGSVYRASIRCLISKPHTFSHLKKQNLHWTFITNYIWKLLDSIACDCFHYSRLENKTRLFLYKNENKTMYVVGLFKNTTRSWCELHNPNHGKWILWMWLCGTCLFQIFSWANPAHWFTLGCIFTGHSLVRKVAVLSAAATGTKPKPQFRAIFWSVTNNRYRVSVEKSFNEM